MKNNTLRIIAKISVSVFFAVCIFIIGVYTAIEAVTYDDGFYARQFEKNHITFYTGIEPDELLKITDEIQLFLAGERDDFNIEGTVLGEHRELFNEQEIFHMTEVRNLYTTYKQVRNIALILLASSIALMLLFKSRCVWKALRNAGIINLAIAFAVGVGVIFFFDPLFTAFHELFFDNDLWLFDSRTSLLIRILTGDFFVAAAERIAVYHVGFSAVLTAAGAFVSKKIDRSKQNEK